jgi:hypothetical protein
MNLNIFRRIKIFYMRRTTIFKQLIFKCVIPAVLALLVLGLFNYLQTKKNLKESINTKNKNYIRGNYPHYGVSGCSS